MESTNLPTDSLYKMLTIGGLVLVIGAFALGWKAIDETQLATIAFAEADTAFVHASAAVRVQYKRIVTEYQTLEDTMARAINKNGVNWEAANEFKGGQPNEFPNLADSLSLPDETHGINFDQRPTATIQKRTGVDDWQRIVAKLRSHRKLVRSFLTASNLTIVGRELVDESLLKIEDIEKLVSEIELASIAIGASEQTFQSAQKRLEWSTRKQGVMIASSIALFLLGAVVFSRASKNWYEQTQRYQDAIIRSEAKEKAKEVQIGGGIAIIREIGLVLIPVIICYSVYFVLAYFRFV